MAWVGVALFLPAKDPPVTSGTPTSNLQLAAGGALEGVFAVVYVDRDWHLAWLADEDGRVSYVVAEAKGGPLATGQVWQVHVPPQPDGSYLEKEGTFAPVEPASAPRSFAPRTFQTRKRDLEPGSHFYTFEAWVNLARRDDPRHVAMELAIDGRAWSAMMAVPEGADVPDYTGKKIRFAGVYSDEGPSSEVTMPGLIFLSTREPIEVLGELEQDPALKREPLDLEGLEAARPGTEVTIAGEIVAQVPGQSLTLRIGGATRILSSGQTTVLPLGREVRVAGRVVAEEGGHTLADARYPAHLYRPDAIRRLPLGDLPEVPQKLSQAWTVMGNSAFLGEIDIVYYDPAWNLAWYADLLGNVGYLRLTDGNPEIAAGRRFRVRFQGLAGVGGLSEDKGEFLRVPEVVEGRPPLARLRSPQQVEGSVYQMFEVEGLVVEREIVDPGHEQLILSFGGRPWRALRVIDPAVEVADLTGQLVRFAAAFVPEKPQDVRLVPGVLYISPIAPLEIVSPLAADPAFACAQVEIGALDHYREGERVRIVGRVAAQEPGVYVEIEDASGQARVQTGQMNAYEPGAVVEAVGIPYTEGVSWRLDDGRVRSRERNSATLAAEGIARLSRVQEILALDRSEAAAGQPVGLSGVISWVDPSARRAFFLDGTAGIALRWEASTPLPPIGTSVRLDGLTLADGEGREVRVETATVNNSFRLPEPRIVTLSQILTGREHAQWVEARGFVRAVQTRSGERLVQLVMAEGEIPVRVSAEVAVEPLVGALVRLKAVACRRPRTPGDEGGHELLCGSRQFISVLERPFEQADQSPLIALEDVAREAAVMPEIGLVHTRGVVTYGREGRFFFLQQGDYVVQMRTPAPVDLAPGTEVEVTGLLGRSDSLAVLRETRVKERHAGASVAPFRLTPTNCLSPALRGRLVDFEAVVLDLRRHDDETVLSVDAVDRIVEVRLTEERASVPFGDGARILVRGIYQPVSDGFSRLQGFTVDVRRPADLTLLAGAPLWTTRRAGWVALGLTAVLAAAFLYSSLLRRQVRQQTEELRERLDYEIELTDRNREIVQNASDFIFTADAGGAIRSINPAGRRHLGYEDGEMPAIQLEDIFQDAAGHPIDLSEWTASNERVSCRMTTAAGETLWVEISLRRIRDAAAVEGILGIVRDISERKEYEEALEEARHAAEANARAKSAFLANMSHEIRTPMNGVIGMSNLMLESELGEEQRSFAHTIRESAEALLRVLDDILDFSKIEAGKLNLEAVPFNLSETVESTLELLASHAAGKGLELVPDVHPAAHRAFVGDPSRLRQVLMNLIGNAIKFTNAGEVVARVRIEGETETSAQLRFEISDTGIGLAPEQIELLFKPFNQADVSTTRRFGGTGLGLAISRQIVELMGGEIGVTSTLGAGSTFWFSLPLDKSDDPEVASRMEPIPALVGARALVIDDSPTNRRVTNRYFRTWGIETVEVATPAEGLAAVQAAAATGQAFEFVILDFQMPGMNGLEVAEALAGLAGAGERHVILLSTVDQRIPAPDLSRLGIESTLIKPVRPSALRSVLLELRQHGAAHPPRVALAISNPVDSGSPEPSLRPARAGVGRILVAEDNAVNQRVARLQLERLGYEVTVVNNGLEAIDKVEEEAFEAVFMDCQMPEVDGYEATRRIRASGRFDSLRIIAMTAHAMEGDREKCLAAGMNDYISKPVRPDALRSVLEPIGTT